MEIYDFPRMSVSSQVFHVPGGVTEGGYSSGGARMYFPEPSGRAMLEIQLSLQTREWETPFISWLMSKTNGEIFRIPLTRTPQLATGSFIDDYDSGIPWDNDLPWDDDKLWVNDLFSFTTAISLEGSRTLYVNVAGIDQALKVGHVIGHADRSYMIDAIEYIGDIATIVVNPPLRQNVVANDFIMYRPKFIGTIANGQEFKASYDAANVGYITPGRILFKEVI